jgi:hypothetical protein
MATKSSSLNSLMNYRFVKKTASKVTHSGSESLFGSDTNGTPQSSKEPNKQAESQTSECSSATILYSDQEGESQNSETTILSDQEGESQNSERTILSDQEGGSQNSEMTILYNNASQDLGSQDPFAQNTEGRDVSKIMFMCCFMRGISESTGILVTQEIAS